MILCKITFIDNKYEGARDGIVVRALTSHQCGTGSNPGVKAICGLSLLLVFSFAPRGFFRVLAFPLSSRTNISKFQYAQESGRRETTLWMCFPQIIIILLLSLLLLSLSLSLSLSLFSIASYTLLEPGPILGPEVQW